MDVVAAGAAASSRDGELSDAGKLTVLPSWHSSAGHVGRVTSVVPVVTAVDTILPVALAPLLFHESPAAAGLLSAVVLVAGFLLVRAGVIRLVTSGTFKWVYRRLGERALSVPETGPQRP